MTKKTNPIIGIKGEPRIMKNPESKIKAFIDVIIPTPFGDMTFRNFKVVDAGKGLFVSLPNRAVKVKARRLTDDDTGERLSTGGETKYYNDFTFANKDKYKEFIEVCSKVLIPAVEARLEKAVKA